MPSPICCSTCHASPNDGSFPRATNISHFPAASGTRATRRRQFLRLSWKRSEEHTSELQSLMRNSYAVFCLKKQNTEENQSRLKTINRSSHHNCYPQQKNNTI